MLPKLDYDSIAKAAYVKISSKPIVKTKQLSNAVIVDLDEKGNLVGVEILYI